jgi:predicted neutral ceramidase superfamily lipid hydrolase
MIDPSIIRPEIALDDFLPIFVSSAFALVFGGFYVGIYTAVKVKLIKAKLMPLAYIFWLLTSYCLYIMGSLMHVGEFTAKALVVAMIGYLLLPHAVYYMQDQVHEENEH